MTRMRLSHCMQRGPPSGTDCYKHWRKRNPGRATPSGASAHCAPAAAAAAAEAAAAAAAAAVVV